jgi:hypothetical protein
MKNRVRCGACGRPVPDGLICRRCDGALRREIAADVVASTADQSPKHERSVTP